MIGQAAVYIDEPQIIEVLPVRTAQNAIIDPNYPEPVRIVFNKPVVISDFQFTVNPPAELQSKLRLVRLRTKKNATFYPAYVFSNTQGLKENTTYQLDFSIKKKSVFDFLFPQKIKVVFKTTKEDKTLPKESGKDLDNRLFRK